MSCWLCPFHGFSNVLGSPYLLLEGAQMTHLRGLLNLFIPPNSLQGHQDANDARQAHRKEPPWWMLSVILLKGCSNSLGWSFAGHLLSIPWWYLGLDLRFVCHFSLPLYYFQSQVNRCQSQCNEIALWALWHGILFFLSWSLSSWN